jgi:hypothetical protein
MKIKLNESGDPFRDIVKQYAKMYRDSELSRIDKEHYSKWLQVHADKMSPATRTAIEKKVQSTIKSKNEASTSSGAGPVSTPFAFSRRGPGNVKAATQLGFKLAKPVAHSKNLSLENQAYSEPAYITPAQYIEPVDTYSDSNGLVQHGDPELDPGLAGYRQGALPMSEAEKKINQVAKMLEGLSGIRHRRRVNEADAAAQATVSAPAPAPAAQPKTSAAPNVQVQSYSLQPDFSEFDTKLKDSTEALKTGLQKKIQDQILNKKIVVRASKGYKQPESDYTLNVTGVNIDYYYDRYVIIIVGREESKQKTAKFFIKPGFKLKILGSADVKPKDRYQIAKSQALVDPNKQASATPSNTVTSKEPPEVSTGSKPEDQSGTQPPPV